VRSEGANLFVRALSELDEVIKRARAPEKLIKGFGFLTSRMEDLYLTPDRGKRGQQLI
jgi:hypothetical protein